MPKWSLDTVHYVAALLDPRRKHKLHKYGVDEHKLTMARRTILSNMRKIMDKLPKKKLKPNHESSLNDISDDSDDDDESKCDYQRESPEYMEINRYYGLRLSHTELLDFDLLKWWHKVTYTSSDGDLAPFPILGLVARSVLCIPASSAMSESNFSDAGNAFGKKRTTLNPYVLDDILVARSSIDTL
ncbi:39S ribosomal protein L24 [Phytophthora nicotianae]|uniref:39S ribosomal protein L24 n=1 Tax=Phytophthora nicotianae TaxID=4792 RepID=A0A0W8CM26_PHYNI|nr:39S ribosomal protein L24 [Phytophthora nicotianae]